jgi:hypothetical protein
MNTAASTPPIETPPAQPTDSAPVAPKPRRQYARHASGQSRIGFGLSNTYLILFGVVLPIGVLITELISSFCAEIYVDPIPTYWHAGMVALVPLANLLVLLARSPSMQIPLKFLDWITALAVGSAFFFTLIFIPITPFAVIGIAFLGIGFLPLSPLLSLVSTLIARRMVRKYVAPHRPDPRSWGRVWKGIAIVSVMVLAYAVPQAVTLTLAHHASRVTSTDEPAAIRNLRTYGSERVLLRLCYAPRAMRRDPIGFVLMEWCDLRVGTEASQRLYYRVTGEPYNASPPPNIRGAVGRREIFNTWEFDPDQGGTAVAGRLRGLTLKESRLDTVVEADAAVAYTEWTMLFLNQSSAQREARAEIALPPGSVVSRLTLWINGEPQEAAFGSREQTRAAYQKVVRRRRDPVLVTTSGRDRVLMQCFPVPPNDGTMQLRIGITSPIPLDSPAEGTLLLPSITERNFGFAPDLAHTFWAESRYGMQPRTTLNGAEESVTASGIHALRGTLPVSDIDTAVPIRIERSPTLQAWHLDKRAAPPTVVQQHFAPVKQTPLERIAMVVDTSGPMQQHAGIVRDAILAMPDGVSFSVTTAGDRIGRVVPWIDSSPETRQMAAEAFAATRFLGGCDNGPALAEVANEIGGKANSAMLWLHATQPVALKGIGNDLGRWNRHGAGAPLLWDMQLVAGPNKLARALRDYERYVAVHPVVHAAGFPEFYAAYLGTQRLARSLVIVSGSTTGAGIEGNDQLARLWAHQALLAKLSKNDKESARELALRYQLVTPVSGAVVLESAAQYKEAGLQQGASDDSPSMSVPSVPEPETWALLIIMAGIMLAGVLHQKRLLPLRR